jgi:hypothetical protein
MSAHQENQEAVAIFGHRPYTGNTASDHDRRGHMKTSPS